MSNPTQPVPVSVVPDDRPAKVVVYSHSPLFYWWPVWAVGFLMAGLSYWQGGPVAFVPQGSEAQSGVSIEGFSGPRDAVVAPARLSLPKESESGPLLQPQMRMMVSNNPGVIWAMTLIVVVIATHVQLRGVWSLVAATLLISLTILFAVLGLWDPILRAVQVIDIHINALGYLSISLVLFVAWLIMFLVIDRLNYMIFTRGRLRVRKSIGEGEKVFDMRGMMFKRHRDDMFRHWLLGFGSTDLTVFTSGANAQQIEMPNVFGMGRKLELINAMLQELEVTKGR